MSLKDWARRLRSKDARQNAGTPCHVCGKYGAISHVHHLVPIEVMIKTMQETHKEYGFYPLCKYSTVSLCPNHHALLHLVTDKGCLPIDMNRHEEEAIRNLAAEQQEAIEVFRADCIDYIIKRLDAKGSSS